MTEREEENEFGLKKGSGGSGSAASSEQELPRTQKYKRDMSQVQATY